MPFHTQLECVFACVRDFLCFRVSVFACTVFVSTSSHYFLSNFFETSDINMIFKNTNTNLAIIR